MWQITDLKKCLESGLSKELAVSTVLQTWSYATLCNCTALESQCSKYVQHHMIAILHSEVILYLPTLLFKELLCRDDFVADEIKIFLAVERFIRFNSLSPQEVVELLRVVRLNEISQVDLREKVAPSGLFGKDKITTAILGPVERAITRGYRGK